MLPNKSTTIIALVLSVILFLTDMGSRHQLSFSISQKITFAPRCTEDTVVAIQVHSGTITSSPGPIPIPASSK